MTHHHNGTEEPGGADEVGAAHDALYTGPIGLPRTGEPGHAPGSAPGSASV
jgi:hypothetical protein